MIRPRRCLGTDLSASAHNAFSNFLPRSCDVKNTRLVTAREEARQACAGCDSEQEWDDFARWMEHVSMVLLMTLRVTQVGAQSLVMRPS